MLEDLGESSLGFKQTQFPAEIASAAGAKAVKRGQFQLPITKATLFNFLFILNIILILINYIIYI